MISVIIVEPETAGNVGAVARVMKNFGFSNLILVNPKCNHLSKDAVDRASHAKDILEKAKATKSIPNLDYLIATTGKIGTDYNLARSPLNPKQLAEKVSRIQNSVGIVFGRESFGLTNTEIAQCDFTVTINASKKYPILNLSHAVAIVLYELHAVTGKEKIHNFAVMNAKEKEQMLKLIDKALDKMEFATAGKKLTQKKLWKRMIGKSMLTKREAFALMGFLRKL
ncbi:RNA methyltransferase [Candidatus Woesearchaeota archaeon]|nr:MAG: RNA methyltransferase [Candidatus Woesearchaeota archaeon]